MADDILYHFSDEEDGEDALLDRAFDRWEQLRGGSARGPLFQFTMQPIGRRRRWRDVVEGAQFNAQLRQLRDPVARDNIWMALTEALHNAIETGLQREQRPAHHFCQFCHHCSRVHPGLSNDQFYCGGVFATDGSIG